MLLFWLIFIPTVVAFVIFLRWFIPREYRTGWRSGRRDAKELFGVDVGDPLSTKAFWREQWQDEN